MKLTLGFSTCPNDTFVFDAMIHGKIDTEGLTFDVILSDIEDLNRMAFEHAIQVTKLSYHAFAFVSENYILLNAGSALGRKNGPLLISRFPVDPEMVKLQRIAIPGKFTTANLLFSLFFPDARDKREYLFSEIEDALLNDEVDSGVIIHENRFTFEKRGLVKLFDLGERWENKTGLPIPLGGIAADKSLPADVLQKMDRVMAKSVAYALQNPDSSREFVKEYAKELDEEVIRQHIALYVNDFTVDLGKEGRDAIVQFFREARLMNIIPDGTEKIFLKK